MGHRAISNPSVFKTGHGILLGSILCTLTALSSGCVSLNTELARKTAYLAQLGSGSAVKIRKNPRNPLEDQLNLFARKGPSPSPRTAQVLRRFSLEELFRSDPNQAYRALREAAEKNAQLESTYAVAEIAYILGVRAGLKKDTDQAIKMYGESLAVSYDYLFSESLASQRNPYDPEFRGACDLYNGSLEGMLRNMADEGFLHPGYEGSIDMMGRRMELACSCSGRWDPEDIKAFLFSSDYEVRGLSNSYRSYGLGVPLIAVRRSDVDASSADEQYYPEGLTFPVTAFFRLKKSIPRGSQTERLICNIEFHDPLDQTTIDVAGIPTPLETDISTPLAYYLNDPLVGTNTVATFALLDANFGKSFEGLYMLEPYDPNKIPVVMVHGLWSSPITWMEMFNDLRASSDIRKNYQFWFYMYPTGQPFWTSAEEMRDDLLQARRELDPDQQSETLDQMVLIGHSMGGLVSRLQTIDSGDRFWSLISDHPFSELETDDETRSHLQQVMFFSPDSSVKRVVTIGTPHRGSEFSNNTTQWLGRQFLVLPNMLVGQQEEVVKQNPDYFNNTKLLTINTSIDSLSPESPFLQEMIASESAPWVKHHNILGVVEANSFDTWLGMRVVGEGDGIVPVTSAQFEKAESEIVVPSPHQKIHQHPLAILEVQRILREHVVEVQRGTRRDHGVQPATYRHGDQSKEPETSDDSPSADKVSENFEGSADQKSSQAEVATQESPDAGEQTLGEQPEVNQRAAKAVAGNPDSNDNGPPNTKIETTEPIEEETGQVGGVTQGSEPTPSEPQTTSPATSNLTNTGPAKRFSISDQAEESQAAPATTSSAEKEKVEPDTEPSSTSN